MDSTTPVDIEHLKTWEGRQETVQDVVSEPLLARFRAALGNNCSTREAVPPGLHWCLTLPAVPTDALGEDGHPQRGDFLPPVPLPRRMWASSDIHFDQPLTVGDEITRRSVVSSVTLKTGRSGDPLVFVDVGHTYTQADQPVIRETQTLVYREVTPYRAAPGAAPAPQVARHLPCPVLLFRYSALTFNAHRIHYDQAYATDREHYPGLVVHGPLVATLLMQAAQDANPEARLTHFSFRGVAPAFVDEPLSLVTGANDQWEARAPGERVTMQAQAGFSA